MRTFIAATLVETDAALVDTESAVVAVRRAIASASEDCADATSARRLVAVDAAVDAATSIRDCITSVLAARVEATPDWTEAMVAERASSLVSTCCWSSWTLTVWRVVR